MSSITPIVTNYVLWQRDSYHHKRYTHILLVQVDVLYKTHIGKMLFLVLDSQCEREAVRWKFQYNSCQFVTLILNLYFLVY